MAELKPCPFCGWEAEERYIRRKLRYRLFHFPDITHFVYIKCKFCGATTSVRETRENAIEEWNRRVDDDEYKR